jgi:cyanuric acid amidohydrolase
VIAVIGKTEGIGGVNDYTRIIADRAFREVLTARGTRDHEAVMEVPVVWSGGTDGVLSPHATIFAYRIGHGVMRDALDADGIWAAIRDAALDDSDVHWHRQIKSCVGGVAAVTGDPAVFVSVSAAHQVPDGGGPVAAVVDLGEGEPTGYRASTAWNDRLGGSPPPGSAWGVRVTDA